MPLYFIKQIQLIIIALYSAGPSFTVDAACSSGLVALWAAFNDIKDGRVESAIVNAGELCMSPVLQDLFYKVGIVSPTGESYPFDKRGKYFNSSLYDILGGFL